MRSLPARPAILRAVAALLLVALLLHLAHNVAGLGRPAADTASDVVHHAILFAAAGVILWRAARVPADRAAWIALGIGVLSWSVGELLWTLVYVKMDPQPFPSVSDGLWLAALPAWYTGLVLLVRGRIDRLPRTAWLDGLIAALALTALVAALVFPSIEATTGGTPETIATNLAYPIGDVVLLGLVLYAFAMASWRPGRVWLLLGAGFLLVAAADLAFLYQQATGTFQEQRWVDALWPSGFTLLAIAALVPPGRPVPGGRDRRTLVVPLGFAVAAVAIIGLDQLERQNRVAVFIALATLGAILARTWLTFRENQRLLHGSREEALTDPLTGLGNRRRLLLDLDDALLAAAGGTSRTLVLFDLDGFKSYNDAFGHPAGDALLQRLGDKLAAAVASHGTAYRLGGDEFCVLLDRAGDVAEPVIAVAAGVLTEEGDAFSVTCSHGAVILPADAADRAEALRVADRRMYAQKDSRRGSAGRQTSDALMRALKERDAGLSGHLMQVGELAREVGRAMGLDAEALDEVARAAELHDVGKVAIPDAILEKPGALTETEWRYMHRHTVIGERILSAAPALVPVARIVRASHERWDGSGYPDRLAGEDIPLGARIVAVCDAFHAMTSNRPYQAAVPMEAALVELRRCAGAQFDPQVVESFCTTVAQGLAAAVSPVPR